MIKKIGLIGEDPHDTIAIKNLLLKRHATGVQFKPLTKNDRGCDLDNSNYAKRLKIEYAKEKPSFVIFIRDVDGVFSEKKKIKAVEEWFNKLNKIVDNKGILLKNIYELEALILTDINAIKSLYGVTINHSKDVTFIPKPKEFLKLKTAKGRKQYHESHCPEIFANLDFDKVLTCSEFNKFYKTFKEKL
ncbi:MAG: hypothetical protein QM541_07820 [Flavobacterium sp.]|nr:hypothetical protein [Flavobacterium sp.]